MTRIVTTGMGAEPLNHILENARPDDRREMFATRRDNDITKVTRELMHFCGLTGTIFWYDDEPVAVTGYLIMWPGVASVWAYGTPKWPHVLPAITKRVIRGVIPSLLGQKVHRAEARTLFSRASTGRWLTQLGATQESLLFEYGRNRETFAVYVWSDHDVDGRRTRAAH